MVDFLVCPTAVVLQHVVLGNASGQDKPFHYRLGGAQHLAPMGNMDGSGTPYQNVGQMLVGDVCELLAVEFGDHKLHTCRVSGREWFMAWVRGPMLKWPLLRGRGSAG